ncbi:hypothetical protein EVAR_103542_1 [Eumeta japonica]|uniref:Uncharacterized protein n=1 Tax=Eumeta variegata TaxID=151549 RepID=A0A4C1YJA9_EUMVA|nr:hypothetical protein EVAR_103542_1 [Eumeta japonica]
MSDQVVVDTKGGHGGHGGGHASPELGLCYTILIELEPDLTEPPYGGWFKCQRVSMATLKSAAASSTCRLKNRAKGYSPSRSKGTDALIPSFPKATTRRPIADKKIIANFHTKFMEKKYLSYLHRVFRKTCHVN